MQTNRLASGGRIDRSNPLHFRFDGRELTGFAGDTLASALLANGHHLVARSIKYHRPRGILSAGLEEPSALVHCADVHGVFTPNLKVTEVLLSQGLIVKSQNNWPSLSHDLGASLQLGAALMSAGFYYKTFKWPRHAWFRVYEKLIRRMAGQGRISAERDEALYDKRNFSCDVLVIGSGPSGLMAALTAARSGAVVALLDQDNEFGGSLLWEDVYVEGIPGSKWLLKVLQELIQLSNVRLMSNTLAFGQYDHGLIQAVQHCTEKVEKIIWKIRARRILLATGAVERPIVFPNNDRPGIMLASAVRQYIRRYAVLPGKRVFLAISDPQEKELTMDALAEANITIVGCLSSGEVLIGTEGRHHLRSVHFVSEYGRVEHRSCDLMCVSAGWMPNAQLFTHTGEKLSFNSEARALVPDDQAGPLLTVGACRGVRTTEDCLKDGADQALVALEQLHSKKSKEIQLLAVERNTEIPYRQHEGHGKAFVDLQNDVTRADLEQAVREGYDDIELAKRYTTLGMGTDQGKTSWTNAILELAYSTGKLPADIGHTTYRPPYSPVSFGALVGAQTGNNMVPVRRTPFHRAFEAAGCVFQTSGDWMYSRYFPKQDETMMQSIQREVECVRTHVGCVDMSTLGKVDVKGRDALLFLSRIYCNNIETINIGRLRYVLMLREDGIIFDDGTVARLDESHYMVTMTTANSASVWRWMNKLLQVHWPDLEVNVISVNDHWACLAIAGPHARKLLQDLEPNFATDAESFPFASVRVGHLGGTLPCRVYSVSFSGESGFEIAVPAAHSGALFSRVLNKGRDYGINPYGLEALDVLRIEKGHLSIGTEINGRTTPADLGMVKKVSRRKDFIGRALLDRVTLRSPDRAQLVGLKPIDNKTPIPVGAHLTAKPWSKGSTQPSQGTLTASIQSPTLGFPIALALLIGGHARMNERLWAVSPVAGSSVEVVVGPSCFVDPKGDRLHE